MLHHRGITAVHEPFNDAFFYGPEMLHPQYENDVSARQISGCSHVTYRAALERTVKKSSKDKRVFVKEIARVIMPFDGGKASIAPSLLDMNNLKPRNAALAELQNPSVLPVSVLEKFQFAFLIRHPCLSVPSSYRLTIPPLSEKTGWHDFYPENIGLHQLRKLFEYLKEAGIIETSASSGLCLVNSEDLLANPAAAMRAFCGKMGLSYDESVLDWSTLESQRLAEEQFGTHLRPWHEAAISSTSLKEQPKQEADLEDAYMLWLEEFGREGAGVVRKNVEDNLTDYEYLQQFALKI